MEKRKPTQLELERSLEQFFQKAVRERLFGRAVKLAPIDKGAPDRLVLLPGGQVYLVELKTNLGRLSSAQEVWHERARELGTEVIVLKGRDEINGWVRKMQTRWANGDPKTYKM